MADKVTFKASVHKDLSNLSKELVTRVWQRLEILKQQPFPRQAAKLEVACVLVGHTALCADKSVIAFACPSYSADQQRLRWR